MKADREFIIREIRSNYRNENRETQCGTSGSGGNNAPGSNEPEPSHSNERIRQNEPQSRQDRFENNRDGERKRGYTSRSGIFGSNAKYVGKDKTVESDKDYLELEVLRAGLFYHENFPVPIIFLKDSDKNVLPVFVGYFEYLFIKYMMERKSFPSATMYDVLLAIFSEFNILLEAIELEICDGKLCCVLVTRSKFLSHFDISPGDGIALAYRTHTPIRMTKETLAVKFVDFFDMEGLGANFEL
ncbi:bifunctional nuclease domain-containing protein [Methanolapillus millepedarum]|uniref:BFN domain-containing protein n=1 Tax=Methanolapillus millepedarum TaxID=3028296 RepID=A0AA96V408_9EURY|nr:hypothetical protein MsAc7_17010 [Methanosarcinaceae archaeon Ac7]